MLDAPYLLNIPGAGSREWLEKFTSGQAQSQSKAGFPVPSQLSGFRSHSERGTGQYLRSLTKGRATEETWQVARQEYSQRAYYSLFGKLRCITEGNFDEILWGIEEDSPEMKAFFL